MPVANSINYYGLPPKSTLAEASTDWLFNTAVQLGKLIELWQTDHELPNESIFVLYYTIH